MKKSTLILVLGLGAMAQLFGDIGCMDNSKHVKIQDGYDYKTLHYVACSCPCKKQRHLVRKGKCFTCRHYIKFDDHAYDMNFLYEKTGDNGIFGRVLPFKYA